MESYNSGSLQSSSGGGVGGCDDEYDSRAAANLSASSPFSSFLNLPPPPRHQLINNTPMFDQSFSANRFQNQNPFLNLDMLNWPSSSKPSSEQTPLNNILPPSSSPRPNPQTLFSSPALAATNSMIRPSRSLPPTTSSSGGTSSTAAEILVPPVRSSKKRSRASRRAPTTVLTTDTNNFRAMVQEFTGIPPPPFSASSHFPIRMTSSNYSIVRPFAHKMQSPSLLLQQVQHQQQQQQQQQQQNAFLSSITSTSNMGIGGGNSSSGNYQMMNHNHHLGDSELGQMIKLYSSPNTNSGNATTNVLGSSSTSATPRVPSNDGQFGRLGSLMGRNVDHLSSQQHGSSRRDENDVPDYSDWNEVVGAGSIQGGRPDVG